MKYIFTVDLIPIQFFKVTIKVILTMCTDKVELRLQEFLKNVNK